MYFDIDTFRKYNLILIEGLYFSEACQSKSQCQNCLVSLCYISKASNTTFRPHPRHPAGADGRGTGDHLLGSHPPHLPPLHALLLQGDTPVRH